MAQLAALASLAGLAGCTPEVGDSCALSTDCSSDGTRVCDTSEPGGYCTILNCTGTNLGSTCPEYDICVQFSQNVPGCPNNSHEPSPISQTFCMAGCATNSDCRADYSCKSPSGQPWQGLILDQNQQALVCMANLWFIDGGQNPQGYGYDGSLDAIPPVCQAAGPSFDAGFPPVPDSGPDAGVDAGDAGKSDAGKKDGGRLDAASDAKTDGTVHHEGGLPDSATDAPRDASSDAADGAHDAGPG
jgi:hypothetical protein